MEIQETATIMKQASQSTGKETNYMKWQYKIALHRKLNKLLFLRNIFEYAYADDFYISSVIYYLRQDC